MNDFNYQPYDRRPYSKKPEPRTKAERELASWGYAQLKDGAPRLIEVAVRRKWAGFHGVLGKERMS